MTVLQKDVKAPISQYYMLMAELAKTQTHPSVDVTMSDHFAGKSALKFKQLLEIAKIFNVTDEEMIRRIFERGIHSEFGYWEKPHAVMVINVKEKPNEKPRFGVFRDI